MTQKEPLSQKGLKDYLTKHTKFSVATNGTQITLNLEGRTITCCVTKDTMTCAKAKAYLKQWASEKIAEYFGVK